MSLQEKMFTDVEAWRSSGMTEHEFVNDRMDIPVILCH